MVKYLISSIIICISLITEGQVPNWTVDKENYQNTMTGVFRINEGCLESSNANDIIGIFDLSGKVRGVQKTNIGMMAYVTIYGNTPGEELVFKVYSADRNKVFKVYGESIIHFDGESIGSPIQPVGLTFSSEEGPVIPKDLLDMSSIERDIKVYNNYQVEINALGHGSWSIFEGVGGSIENNLSPNTSFTGSIGNSYILAWTIPYNQCNSLSFEYRVHLVKEADGCPLNRSVNQSDIDDSSSYQAYRAQTSISSSGVLSDRYYEFSAGNEIILMPGFEISSNTPFVANIADCPN